MNQVIIMRKYKSIVFDGLQLQLVVESREFSFLKRLWGAKAGIFLEEAKPGTWISNTDYNFIFIHLFFLPGCYVSNYACTLINQ